jgi:hypothetical protein
MEKVLVSGYATTGLASVADRDGIDVTFAANWVVKTQKPGEVILANKSAAADQPFELRIARQDIKDIYKGTGINPAYQGANREGIALVVQATYVPREEIQDGSGNLADASYRVDLPISVHKVYRIPKASLVDQAVVRNLDYILEGALFQSDGETLRIGDMLKGALIPSDL